MRTLPSTRWPCWARSSRRPGGADDDVDALAQRVELGLVRPAAVDGEHAGAEPLAGCAEVAGHLNGELAGRCDHQGLGRSRVAAGQVDAVQQRDTESEGLAGAGAGLADEVTAGERDRQGQFLDGEGADDADLGQRGDDLGLDVEVAEGRALGPHRVRERLAGRPPHRCRRCHWKR